MPGPSIPPAATTPPAATAPDRALARQAARDFEALLIERLLATARPPSSGPAADWRAMADRAVAQDIAEASPLGIATLLEPRP